MAPFSSVILMGKPVYYGKEYRLLKLLLPFPTHAQGSAAADFDCCYSSDDFPMASSGQAPWVASPTLASDKSISSGSTCNFNSLTGGQGTLRPGLRSVVQPRRRTTVRGGSGPSKLLCLSIAASAPLSRTHIVYVPLVSLSPPLTTHSPTSDCFASTTLFYFQHVSLAAITLFIKPRISPPLEPCRQCLLYSLSVSTPSF